MSEEKKTFIRQKRDAKVEEHLSQYAPVWMVKEDFLLEEDSVRFDIMFYHPQYGWVSRRYRYDSYNNVLYHHGQVLMDEDETYELQTQDPYLSSDVLNSVNSYGG